MHDQDYSIEEAAALIQAPVETVRLGVSKKLMGAYELGRGWRISAGEGAPLHPA